MSSDWQTWAALAVVAVTAVLFVRRIFGKKKNGGGDCDSCGSNKKK